MVTTKTNFTIFKCVWNNKFLMMCIDVLFEDVWFKDVLFEDMWFKDVLYKCVIFHDGAL